MSWEKSNGLPREIRDVFAAADDHGLRDAQLALAIPEYKVSINGGHRPSQNDVFALLTSSAGLITMMVEGKAREDFDGSLKQWRKKTSPQGVQARMTHILANIALVEPIPDRIRYQLLHRAASAVIEASRFHAKYATLLVQSFVDDDDKNHFDDFAAFLSLYGKKARKETLIQLHDNSRCRLYAAWVQSK